MSEKIISIRLLIFLLKQILLKWLWIEYRHSTLEKTKKKEEYYSGLMPIGVVILILFCTII
jgi:hypothetical protein